MTQELVDNLIKWYEDTIVLINNNPKDLDYILSKRECQFGICNCASIIFKQDIFDDIWLKSKLGTNCYLCHPPRKSYYLDDAISYLQKRIDILKTFS